MLHDIIVNRVMFGLGAFEFGVFQGVNEFLIFLFLSVLQDAILP